MSAIDAQVPKRANLNARSVAVSLKIVVLLVLGGCLPERDMGRNRVEIQPTAASASMVLHAAEPCCRRCLTTLG